MSEPQPCRIGLRIDVDTYRGTRLGVPALVRVLGAHGVRASFFFSVGPDNMGRHLWRLLRPAFLAKMLRSRAASLYGWDVLLRGTLWPGPVIGERLSGTIRAAADAGHEVGLHAWDHHAWQARLERMDAPAVRRAMERGVASLTRILGTPPTCSAAPGWRCSETALRESERFGFRYSSDCRGASVFRPVVDGKPRTTQIPVTLPTYDEVVGRHGVTRENYNAHLLSLLRPARLNVLTVHAEVEGIACIDLFEDFLRAAGARAMELVALGELLVGAPPAPSGAIEQRGVAGRAGTVCWQRGAFAARTPQ